MRNFYSILLLLLFSCAGLNAYADQPGEEDSGFSWGDYGEDSNDDGVFDNIYEILDEVMTNGIENFPEGVTVFTFDGEGNVLTEDYYTFEEVMQDMTLIPEDAWEVFESLNEYIQQEEAYQEANVLNWKNVGNYNYDRTNYLNQVFEGTNYRFTVGTGNLVYVWDASGAVHEFMGVIDSGKDQIRIGVDDNAIYLDIPWPGLNWNPEITPEDRNEPPSWGDIPWDLPDYEHMPTTPFDPFNENWLYWFYGNGGTYNPNPTQPPSQQPPPPTPPLEISPNNGKLPAKFDNITNYLTPAGTPITLPDAAEVIQIGNVDINYFPNGALYAFEYNGKKYGAKLSFYTTSVSGLGVNPPQFQGYYEMVNGLLNLNAPYPFNSGNYPIPQPDGTIRVLRLKVVKGADGNCKLVREVVSYKKGTFTPATVSGLMIDINDEIENLEIVPGRPSEEKPIDCPKSQAGATGNTWNLDQYIVHRGADLAKFFYQSFRNKVKVIFYDCATNKAKYTLDNSGKVNTITGVAQDQEMTAYNNPTATSADVLIKACLDNTNKWNYDVKLNPAKDGISGQVHSKMLAKLAEIKQIIKKHADLEVELLKKAGAMNTLGAAKIDAGNGEFFKKENMDLIQSLAAIYDIGKSMIKNGAMPETVWDQGRRSAGVSTPEGVKKNYDASPFNLTSGVAGCADQVGDEITGVVQMVETAYEFIRHPRQTFNGIWEGVRNLDKEKVKQILSNASGHANYVAGGDRGWYQGGRHSVQVSMILVSGLKSITKGLNVVKRTGNDLTEIQSFIPAGSVNHPASTALKNAADNGLVVERINEKRILTKNVEGGENKMVVFEKNAADTRVYKYNKNDYKDANGNLPTDAQVEQFVKQDLNEVEMPPHTSQPSDFPDQGPPATNVSYNPQGRKNLGWNKELNEFPPKANHTYVTKHASFHTDASGKVTKVEIPTLQKDPNFDYNNLRNTHQQKKSVLDKNGVAGTDQGGHLLGSQFGGPGEQINLVPMKQSLNQPPGEWWQMEQSWATQVNNGVSITNIKIEIIYGANSRPTGFNVEWFENGTKRTKFHNNN